MSATCFEPRGFILREAIVYTVRYVLLVNGPNGLCSAISPFHLNAGGISCLPNVAALKYENIEVSRILVTTVICA